MQGISDDITLYEFCIHNQEYSKLLNLWSDKNLPLTPQNISIRSKHSVYWNIREQNIEISVYGMIHTLKNNMYGRHIVKNSLLTNNPTLCKEWDY
ncbi:MAG: hypothetical protein J6A59_00220, partial [Lachnospiraceae bacterium]|nr:hypothetical protein [Lachnospiraceae bacterium]